MIVKQNNQDFLKIYMDIINNLRENGKVFSQQNPELAPYLDLSYRKSNDPETERLIESFAYMFAQVEHKSVLAQNDYAVNFIDHIFPELITSIPALTVLKVIPEKSFFSNEKLSFIVPKLTSFSVKNQSAVECLFSTSQEMPITCLDITSTRYIDSNTSKEDIGKNKKAFILNFESSAPFAVSKQNPLNLSIYIDSDFYSAISIYDALFSEKKPLSLFIESGTAAVPLSRENICPIYQFESQDKNNNVLYPIFDFLNFYQKYFFFELKIDAEFLVKDKFKLVIPIHDSLVFPSRIGNSFFQLNCLPVTNTFERKMEPMKCSKEKDEYFLRVDGALQNEVEILSIKSLKTYNSKTGEAYSLQNFHGQAWVEHGNIQNPYGNFVWATKRSFYDPTNENGSFHLKLFLAGKRSKEEAPIWPDYLFPTGICTNGSTANSIKPKSLFQCHLSSLPIEKAYSLFWPKYSMRALKYFGNTEILKLLYEVNQEIISNKILQGSEFEKVMGYLCPESNPVNEVIKKIFLHSNGFAVEESISQRVWKKQTYHVPGVVYKLQFLKNSGFPVGTQFLIYFLNAYFNYIRDFNFHISFEAVII
jgi:type VI secretion system protein ImpG